MGVESGKQMDDWFVILVVGYGVAVLSVRTFLTIVDIIRIQPPRVKGWVEN